MDVLAVALAGFAFVFGLRGLVTATQALSNATNAANDAKAAKVLAQEATRIVLQANQADRPCYCTEGRRVQWKRAAEAGPDEAWGTADDIGGLR